MRKHLTMRDLKALYELNPPRNEFTGVWSAVDNSTAWLVDCQDIGLLTRNDFVVGFQLWPDMFFRLFHKDKS